MKRLLLGFLIIIMLIAISFPVSAIDLQDNLSDTSSEGYVDPDYQGDPLYDLSDTSSDGYVDFKGSSLGDPSYVSEPTLTPAPATTNIDFKGSSLGDPSRAGEPTPTPAQDIIVKVNNKPIVFDVKPTIINNRTLVPLRAIFEALGAQVTWNGDTNTIYSSKGNSIIILQIDNKMAFVNSKEVTLDVAPQIIEDRTLVPARFIAEALGADVQWDDATSTVIITTAEMKTKHDTVKNSINNVR